MFAAEIPDFRGKVVFVQLPAEGHWWALDSPYFERQGGSLVLIGKPCNTPGKPHWADGSTVCIPWKYIGYYVIFESVEHYQSTAARAAPTSEAKPRRGWLGWQ